MIGATEDPIKLAAKGAPLARTDIGFAERFAYQHKDKCIYQSDAGLWLTWDGKRWNPDPQQVAVRALGMDTARMVMKESAAFPTGTSDADRISHFKYAIRCEAKERIIAGITLAASIGLSRPLSDFNKAPFLFNCANGTLNLLTGEIHKAKREDFITKLSPVEYNASIQDELFDKFIHHITAGDTELAAYLQRAAGYSLTGVTSEKALMIIFSEKTDTGKSSFVEGLLAAMGDYGISMEFETFLESKGHGSSPRYDLAKLHGVRMACAAENDYGRKFSGETIKRLTGGDTIRAREIRQSSVEFRPTHKLWLCTNHAPNLDGGGDAATWNRIRRVPFNNQIPRDQRDPRIKQALEDPNSPSCRAFLAWAIAGCVAWNGGGLGTCAAVEASTEAYREETDPLLDFIDDRCSLSSDAQTASQNLYSEYHSWCSENHQNFPLGKQKFAECLSKHGLIPARITGGTRIWRGVSIKASSIP